MSDQHAVRTVIMRGGTSKALFVSEADLPKDPDARNRFLLALFGSPDKRQIDGLGGAEYLTSKCAIIGPPSLRGAHVDYTIAQVSVEHPIVSFDTNCGNISAAVGPYAIEEGMVEATEPWTEVRVHNTNTGKILRLKVPVRNGRAVSEGTFEIDGVPGTGAEIELDFALTEGAATGRLLPTGRPSDRIALKTLGRSVDVSVVDVGNPCVYVRASDLGLGGYEMPGTLSLSSFALLEEIRKKSGALSGIASYLLPFQITVAEPADYVAFGSGRPVPATTFDVGAHLHMEGTMHQAYAATGATCLAVAARIEGTVVHAVCRKRAASDPIRIGHPSGILGIVSDVRRDGERWTILRVVFSRTARRLMDGTAYISPSRL